MKTSYLLVCYILLILKIFSLTPIQIISDLLLIGLAAVGFGLYFLDQLQGIKRTYFKYVRWFFLLSVLSIFTSYYFYGQDFFSGLVASKDLLLVLSAAYPLLLYKKRRVDLHKIMQVVLNCAWVYFAYLAIISILDVSYVFSSPLSGEQIVIEASKASTYLINFATCIYLAKFLVEKQYKYLLLMLLMFSANHFNDIQRSPILVLVIILGLMSLKLRSSYIMLKYVALVPFLALLFFVFKGSDTSTAITEKFDQATLLFVGDEQITDASVFIRVEEFNFAMKNFRGSPIVGKGQIRASNAEDAFNGVYFYYSDIGIFSVLFAFGLLGMLVFGVQLWDWAKVRFKSIKRNPVLLTLYIYCLYLLMMSLMRGITIFTPLQFVFFMCILSWETKKRSYE